MSLFKAASTVSLLTLASRVTGLVRDLLMASVFGVSAMTDAFNVAFRIPNLFRRVLGEGAFSQAFVPVLAACKAEEGEEGAKRLIDHVATLLTWALVLLCVAGVSCCVAMSMPQVHIVAYCGDLGFGAARGAEMLSLMLGMGVVSRLVSGWISDRIGGLRTLLLGSLLQGVALLLFLPFDGLVSLYLVAGLFGLLQGGIVPAYALIVREYFSPSEAGSRVGTVLMATLFGMALGGWMSGAVFDLTGSYRAAFLNGIAWNLLNVAIVSFLLYRAKALAAGIVVRPWPNPS